MVQIFNLKVKPVASLYKDLIKIKVTDSSFKKDIEEYPFFSGLLSFSDTFNKYHIPKAACNVPTENFDDVEAPFIAWVNMSAVAGDFMLVPNIVENEIKYQYGKNCLETISKEVSIKRFKNIVFRAEPDKSSMLLKKNT
jgi:hypothetical protein